MKKYSGFTLLELLVSIAIMALISVSAYQVLSNSIKTKEKVSIYDKQLSALQKANLLIERDLTQVIGRVSRDEYGDPLPPLLLKNNQLEFTRMGWRNPLNKARSDMQHLRYFMTEKKFFRKSWPSLDRAINEKGSDIVLMNDIDKISFQVFSQGKWLTEWPTIDSDPKKTTMPEAIEIIISTALWGDIRRVILLPEYESNE